jgi:SAM-dependent methyltransferase
MRLLRSARTLRLSAASGPPSRWFDRTAGPAQEPAAAADAVPTIAGMLSRWQRRLRYRVPGERTTCPACAGPIVHLEPLLLNRRRDEYRVGFISGCRRCGLLFANPYPAADEVEALYAAGGDWSRRHDDAPSTKRPPAAYLQELFRPMGPALDVAAPRAGARVLDIGCGNGELLDAFQDSGWHTFGIEPSGRAAFRRHGELTAIPTDGSFDVVVLHHVLEHVASPLEMLCAVRGALGERGVVAISVPRLDAVALHGDLKYCINAHAHLLSYTRDALATLLGLAGFAPVDVSRPLGAPVPKSYMLRRLQMLGVKGISSPEPPGHPLAAARLALRRYHDTHGQTSPPRYWPVRVRAALLNEARRTRRARRASGQEHSSAHGGDQQTSA